MGEKPLDSIRRWRDESLALADSTYTPEEDASPHAREKAGFVRLLARHRVAVLNDVLSLFRMLDNV